MAALTGRDVYVRLAEESQIGSARRKLSDLARRVGFDDVAVGRVAIAVTELASNVVRHGGGGELFGRPVDMGTRTSVEVVAVDRGPGIGEPDRALEDGFTTAGSAGTGLGAVARMSDAFSIHSPDEGGTVCVLRIGPEPLPPGETVEPPRDLGLIRRPHPAEEVSGDGWAVRERDGRVVVMVCDGLGHGRRAREASERAIDVFRETSWGGLTALMEALHEALRSTRGAAVSVADADLSNRTIRYVGIGNVGGAVVSGAERVGFVSRNGTVGHQVRTVAEYDYDFPRGSLLVMHSDGIRSRWDARSLQPVLDRPTPVVAATFYLLHGRRRDDATVLVLRNRR